MQQLHHQTPLVDRHGVLADSARADPRQHVLDTAAALGGWGLVDWLVQHWPLWGEFKALADAMRLRGRGRYSARDVLHVLRWHRAIGDAAARDLKVSHAQSAELAALYNAVTGTEYFPLRKRR